MAEPRPSASVILVRDGEPGLETFMVQRHARSRVAPSAYVFPGGTVRADDFDTADIDLTQLLSERADTPVARDEAGAYLVSAVRELFEEAGVLLARHPHGDFVSLAGAADHERLKQDRPRVHEAQTTLRAVVERERLHLALDALVLFSHWVTPPIDSRQFDTRFFMARVPAHQTPAHDDTETTHSLWVRPADAIAQAERHDIVLPPPTWITLRELEPFATVEAALAWARTRIVTRRMPKAMEQDGHRMLLMPGDPLHPDPPGDDVPLETRFVLVDRRWRAERPPT